MRRFGNLWDEFVSKENWDKAVKNSLKGKKALHSVRRFLEKAKAIRKSFGSRSSMGLSNSRDIIQNFCMSQNSGSSTSQGLRSVSFIGLA